MRISPRPLPINPEDPFSGDLFNRKPFAEVLEKLLVDTTDGAVVSLESEWGEGKTTFVRMWQAHLEKKSIQCVYIDAFKIDAFADPFSALAAEIDAFAHRSGFESKVLVKAKSLAKTLLSISGKLGAKAATLGLIGTQEWDSFSELKGSVLEGQDKFIDAAFDKKVSSYLETNSEIEALKNALSKLGQATREKTKAPLIIIIDELDRCSPTYAIEFLESIKHYFNSDDVNYLLVLNSTQLEDSLRSCYGSGLNGRRYLQKFIDVSMSLPLAVGKVKEQQLITFCRQAIEAHEVDHHGDIHNMAEAIADLANLYGSPLREIEKVITRVCLAYSVLPKNHFRPFDFLAYLCFVRQYDLNLYQLIRLKKAPVNEMIKKLEDMNEKERPFAWIDQVTNLIRWSLLSNDEINSLPEDKKPKVDHVKNFRLRDRDAFLDYVLSLIDNITLR